MLDSSPLSAFSPSPLTLFPPPPPSNLVPPEIYYEKGGGGGALDFFFCISTTVLLAPSSSHWEETAAFMVGAILSQIPVHEYRNDSKFALCSEKTTTIFRKSGGSKERYAL